MKTLTPRLAVLTGASRGLGRAMAHGLAAADIGARVGEELARIGKDAPVAVLPDGFAVVPYLTGG